MTTARSICIASARWLAGLAICVAIAVPAAASDWIYRPFELPRTYTAELGARFWYGRGSTAKDLYNPAGTSLNSRLTYSDYSIYSAEAFGRFDLNTGWFLKGFVGGGGFRGGTLKDEDFPPAISPYSATLSSLNSSAPAYMSVDVGYNVLRGPDFHVGAFAGYHFLSEITTAFGCTQVASNPFVCVNVPSDVKVITQSNNWHSMRVGAEAAVEIDRWKLSADAAWLPLVRMEGWDAHWLRIGTSFTGPVPEDGNGWGYQLESVLSYRVTDRFSVGVGGRFWHMETNGHTHFEGHVIGGGGSPQPLNWRLDNYGVFVQGSMQLGPYFVFGAN